jgi:hypothetical protein
MGALKALGIAGKLHEASTLGAPRTTLEVCSHDVIPAVGASGPRTKRGRS